MTVPSTRWMPVSMLGNRNCAADVVLLWYSASHVRACPRSSRGASISSVSIRVSPLRRLLHGTTSCTCCAASMGSSLPSRRKLRPSRRTARCGQIVGRAGPSSCICRPAPLTWSRSMAVKRCGLSMLRTHRTPATMHAASTSSTTPAITRPRRMPQLPASIGAARIIQAAARRQNAPHQIRADR